MKTLTKSRAGLRTALLAFAGLALQGAGFAVTVSNDKDYTSSQTPIAGSLRHAIVNTPAGGTVDFSSSMKGKTIKLKGGQLVVDKALTITGLGCQKLAVSGNNASRVFFVTGTNSNPGQPGVTISDLTITKGNGVGPDLSGSGNDSKGGGLQNAGTLTLSRVCVTANKAPLDSGGGIYNSGTLTVKESTVSYNTTGLNGGGIADDSNLFVFNSAIINNNAEGTRTGPVCGTTRPSCHVNSCGGGGGGTRDGGFGGGVQTAGNFILVNSSVCSNRAAASGGGINDAGFATIGSYNATVASNTAAVGGGMANPGIASSWQLFNTIVGDNSAATAPDVSNPAGQQISQGKNLIENTSGVTGSSLLASDITGQDPKLGPLQNNGGATLTKALLPGSPAIDKGSNTVVLTATYPGSAVLLYGSAPSDQRLFISRILNGGTSATTDIGAYEYATARSLKYEAIADITPCLSSPDAKTRAYATSAIRSIQCSLSPRLWESDIRLTCFGELVFEYEEDAAYALSKIIKYSTDPACAKRATDAVEDILLADEQLARVAISDATACNGNSYYISKANAEMTTAQASIAKADYKGAVEHYEHAWEYAQKACNRSRSDDDCRNHRQACDDEDRNRWGDDDRCHGDDDDDDGDDDGHWRDDD